ncbi:predicted protein [Naegleria gruberi]|uniref:Predicted protein n=1 Tax=Naegleria gruberi TaxID=5762 RepID=D2V8Z1_NAEGR|nr:uncharacterized protein NAEGRDRAFT_65332 [Naegleria gruberi]EFC46775.1 predicted protein [Naegleria gruberi]|eukprot:XP_002679519.1 predicted protein [Naegleria gruberi strain NEG-M]
MDESLKLYKELMTRVSNNGNNTRVVLLFTKPDIMMRKLRSYIEFGRLFETETLTDLSRIVNDYHERDVLNTIISSYLNAINNIYGKIPEYHIIQSISELDISQLANVE